MTTRHYLVRRSGSASANPSSLEVSTLEAAQTLPVAISIEDLSLVMGEPALGVKVTGTDDEHDRLREAWTSTGLLVASLDEEVLALRYPGEKQ